MRGMYVSSISVFIHADHVSVVPCALVGGLAKARKRCAVSHTVSVQYFKTLASVHLIDISRITLPSTSTTNNPAVSTL